MKRLALPALALCLATTASAQDRAQFQDAVHLPDLSGPGFEAKPDISDDRLTLLFATDRAGGFGELDVWMAARPDPGAPFGPPVNVVELNSEGRDHTPTTTADGLEIVFSSSRDGGLGSDDAWMSTRPDTQSPWGPPVHLANLSSDMRDMGFTMTPDGLCLYYTSNRGGGKGGFDLYASTRSNRDSSWTDPIRLDVFNTPFDDKFPSVTADNRTLYFASNRPGSVLDDEGNPSLDIWVAMRPDENSSFGLLENLHEVNTKYGEYLMSIANDQTELFFVSDRPGGVGGFDLYHTLAVPGVRRYGQGLPGELGIPRLRTAGGAPALGNGSFAFEITNIAPFAKGFYVVSRYPAFDPDRPLLIGPFIEKTVFQRAAEENPPGDVPRLIAAPIPDNPNLVGRTSYCQAVMLDPLGAGEAGGRTFSMSPGLKRTILDSP